MNCVIYGKHGKTQANYREVFAGDLN